MAVNYLSAHEGLLPLLRRDDTIKNVTPSFFVVEGACVERSPTDGYWICTREAGHDGMHLAMYGEGRDHNRKYIVCCPCWLEIMPPNPEED